MERCVLQSTDSSQDEVVTKGLVDDATVYQTVSNYCTARIYTKPNSK